MDKTLFVDRIRPDVIQTAARMTMTVGGKANNVARVLKAYGRFPVAMNFLGGETGRLCERLLREEDGVATETVWTAAATREIITIHETERNAHTDIKEPSPGDTGGGEGGVSASLYRAGADGGHGGIRRERAVGVGG